MNNQRIFIFGAAAIVLVVVIGGVLFSMLSSPAAIYDGNIEVSYGDDPERVSFSANAGDYILIEITYLESSTIDIDYDVRMQVLAESGTTLLTRSHNDDFSELLDITETQNYYLEFSADMGTISFHLLVDFYEPPS